MTREFDIYQLSNAMGDEGNAWGAYKGPEKEAHTLICKAIGYLRNTPECWDIEGQAEAVAEMEDAARRVYAAWQHTHKESTVEGYFDEVK